MSTKKTVFVAVINDLATDQRVHKTCQYLHEKDFDVTAYGRCLSDTFQLKRAYKTLEKKHWFNSKFIFYIEYNLRLFWLLLFKKYNYILANDLDTLTACFIASKLKKSTLVFDAHEHFTETPEVQGRAFVQNFWKSLEKCFIPRIKNAYTVSQKIADYYEKNFSAAFEVLRNVPKLENTELIEEAVSFPTKNKIILYQGKLTKNRGLTQIIEALNYLEGIDLVIIGHGKEAQNLKDFVRQKNLEERVHFLGRIPYEKLHNYTKLADIGIILEEPVGDSFQYALPNKLFDYIHCELPFIAYPLLEVKKIIEEHQVGVLVESHDPKHIAEKIKTLISDKNLLAEIKNNQKTAKAEFCWEKESKLLDKYFT